MSSLAREGFKSLYISFISFLAANVGALKPGEMQMLRGGSTHEHEPTAETRPPPPRGEDAAPWGAPKNRAGLPRGALGCCRARAGLRGSGKRKGIAKRRRREVSLSAGTTTTTRQGVQPSPLKSRRFDTRSNAHVPAGPDPRATGSFAPG